MDTKALRVFYRESDNQIVWTHELRGSGEFPTTLVDDLAEIPDKVISMELDAEENIVSQVKLGGRIEDYACIEEQDPQKATNALLSDSNRIVLGKLKIGDKRITSKYLPPGSEGTLEALEKRIAKLEKGSDESI